MGTHEKHSIFFDYDAQLRFLGNLDKLFHVSLTHVWEQNLVCGSDGSRQECDLVYSGAPSVCANVVPGVAFGVCCVVYVVVSFSQESESVRFNCRIIATVKELKSYFNLVHSCIPADRHDRRYISVSDAVIFEAVGIHIYGAVLNEEIVQRIYAVAFSICTSPEFKVQVLAIAVSAVSHEAYDLTFFHCLAILHADPLQKVSVHGPPSSAVGDVDIVPIYLLIWICIAIAISTTDYCAVLDCDYRLIAIRTVIPTEVQAEMLTPIHLGYFYVS